MATEHPEKLPNGPEAYKDSWLEYLEALRDAAYQSFSDRRSYEWKFSLALWTAIAVMIAGLVQPIKAGDAFPFQGFYFRVGGLVFGLLILFLHIFFNNYLARANAIDRKKVIYYSRHIESALPLVTDTALGQEIDRRISELPKLPEKTWLQWWQWGHIVQVLLTGVLLIIAELLFWARTS
jgi:hypothetical protein